jgi:hypothetical protein
MALRFRCRHKIHKAAARAINTTTALTAIPAIAPIDNVLLFAAGSAGIAGEELDAVIVVTDDPVLVAGEEEEDVKIYPFIGRAKTLAPIVCIVVVVI